MLWILPIPDNSPPPRPEKVVDKFAKIKLKKLNPKTIFHIKSKKGACGKTIKQGCKCKKGFKGKSSPP